jgi:tRNA U34 5-carboxymethylaminomethyl modifying GTPase MnmE/TrmE
MTTAMNEVNALPLSDPQRTTIYALSTPPGKSGITVIRVSGPDTLSIWQRMVRPVRGRARVAHTAHIATGHDPDVCKHNNDETGVQRHPEP